MCRTRKTKQALLLFSFNCAVSSSFCYRSGLQSNCNLQACETCRLDGLDTKTGRPTEVVVCLTSSLRRQIVLETDGENTFSRYKCFFLQKLTQFLYPRRIEMRSAAWLQLVRLWIQRQWQYHTSSTSILFKKIDIIYSPSVFINKWVWNVFIMSVLIIIDILPSTAMKIFFLSSE